MTEKINIECPKCGQSQGVMLWRSINISLNPELLGDLFDDKINRFRCSFCGHQASVDTPLIYHDMDRKYAVNYYPFESIDDDDFFEQFTPEGKLKIEFSSTLSRWMTGENYLTESHIVFTIDEMKRYIVFRGRLHDVIGGNASEPDLD